MEPVVMVKGLVWGGNKVRVGKWMFYEALNI
jgi:hypothetical protein